MADKTCSCTGMRSCLLCQTDSSSRGDTTKTEPQIVKYFLCLICGKTVAFGQNCTHIDFSDQPTATWGLSGVTVIENFITADEENMIVREIEKTKWKPSQSGRSKQDYGPQVNFKRKKIKATYFNGLPSFSKFLVERMWRSVSSLADFQPVELCNLEYLPDKGSSIDPHVDDFWLWGDRLITLNLLSSTVLTMSHDDIKTEVSVIMPQRSLIIVSGPARYQWKHAVKRGDIRSRRIAVTLRELSPEFCKGGKNESTGSQIVETALTFEGTSVQVNMAH